MSDALDNFIRTTARSTHLTQKEKNAMIDTARDIAMEAWRSGVQAGYRKILQDHRDGAINVSSASQNAIADAITAAQNGNLMPSEFFGGK